MDTIELISDFHGQSATPVRLTGHTRVPSPLFVRLLRDAGG
jgi:hypothetical protein